VQFYVVYIREAHAADSSWPILAKGFPVLLDPETGKERAEAAGQCMVAMQIKEIPALIDDMDDSVNKAYNAWPDRLFLVDTKGRIAFRADRGPWGFKPDLLEKSIRKELGLPEKKAKAVEAKAGKKDAHPIEGN